ncbi:hypothetical protein KI809_10595 [Geobacter pelophilus]|uniref:Uncharacterized protein n=1 Tax=Geoanaerobacter pelophilus TaxID=60036 RepID=A0AAW4L6S9_9BACT|nr:hypothetical protein [Geoanaerobacter pelophilus]MBT0664748.1 hypothetical protein [Geoanaerobacter pelophilus]
MFISREEKLVLKKHKHKQLLNMFRGVLTRVSGLKQGTLNVDVSAHFQDTGFSFDITVFTLRGDNTSLTIYDFWEVKQSQNLVDAYILAIKTGNFEKVKTVGRL